MSNGSSVGFMGCWTWGCACEIKGALTDTVSVKDSAGGSVFGKTIRLPGDPRAPPILTGIDVPQIASLDVINDIEGSSILERPAIFFREEFCIGK